MYSDNVWNLWKERPAYKTSSLPRSTEEVFPTDLELVCRLSSLHGNDACHSPSLGHNRDIAETGCSREKTTAATVQRSLPFPTRRFPVLSESSSSGLFLGNQVQYNCDVSHYVCFFHRITRQSLSLNCLSKHLDFILQPDCLVRSLSSLTEITTLSRDWYHPGNGAIKSKFLTARALSSWYQLREVYIILKEATVCFEGGPVDCSWFQASSELFCWEGTFYDILTVRFIWIWLGKCLLMTGALSLELENECHTSLFMGRLDCPLSSW